MDIPLVSMIMMLNYMTVFSNSSCRKCPYVEQKGGLFVVQLEDGVKLFRVKQYYHK